MIFALLALAAAAGPTDACRRDAVNKVITDLDVTAPFVLSTMAGIRYRLAGQDFIHPRNWHSGDQLNICAQPGPGRWVEIKDESRGEELGGWLIKR